MVSVACQVQAGNGGGTPINPEVLRDSRVIWVRLPLDYPDPESEFPFHSIQHLDDMPSHLHDDHLIAVQDGRAYLGWLVAPSATPEQRQDIQSRLAKVLGGEATSPDPKQPAVWPETWEGEDGLPAAEWTLNGCEHWAREVGDFEGPSLSELACREYQGPPLPLETIIERGLLEDNSLLWAAYFAHDCRYAAADVRTALQAAQQQFRGEPVKVGSVIYTRVTQALERLDNLLNHQWCSDPDQPGGRLRLPADCLIRGDERLSELAARLRRHQDHHERFERRVRAQPELATKFPDYRPGPLDLMAEARADQWDFESPLSERELKAVVDEFLTVRQADEAKAQQSADARPEEPPGWRVPLKVGKYTVGLRQPRQTPGGKIIAKIYVWADGRQRNLIDLSDSSHGRRQVVKTLEKYLGDQAEATVTELLLRADHCLRSAPEVKGQTIQEILQAEVPPKWDFKCQTAHGLWSEARGGEGRGGEVTRAKFIEWCPPWLINKCEAATDAPRDKNSGEINRQALIRVIKAEMGVLWSAEHDWLPPRSEAKLGINSAAGRNFRALLVRVLTNLLTMEVPRQADGTSFEPFAAKTSLAAKALHKFTEWCRSRPGHTSGWQPIHEGADAYWRGERLSGVPEPVLRLALRYTAFGQMNVPLPASIVRQEDLSREARQFGLAELDPTVVCRLSGGHRPLVLSQDLVAEVTTRPLPEAPPADHSRDGGEVLDDQFGESFPAE